MSSTELEQRVPTGGLIQKVRGDEFTRDQIRQALPASVSLDRFARATITALIQNQDLARADETSLFQSVVRCAQDGLLPDGREAALVIYGGKVQYLPMIGGVRKIAVEFGWTIRTHVVYANDEFVVEQGTEDRILHRPAPIGTDRGALVAAYAIAHHRDGRRSITEVMTEADVMKAKSVSKSDAVWSKWPAQMWEKTVGHRIGKKLPLDPQDAERFSRVIDAAVLADGEAATTLYGPNTERMRAELVSGFGEQPAGVIEVEHTQDSPGLSPADEATVDEPNSSGGATQEGEAAGTADASQTAAAGTGGTASPSPPTDEDEMLALEAAEFVAPSGTYGPDREGGALMLAAIYALPNNEGRKYLKMLMKKLTQPQEYVDAVFAFCRVSMPEEYQQVLAEKALA